MTIAVVLVLVAVVIVAGGLLWRRGGRRRLPSGPPSAPVTVAGPGLGGRIGVLLGRAPGPAAWAALEEALLEADLGVAATSTVVSAARELGPTDATAARSAVRAGMLAALEGRDRSLDLDGLPAVVVVVGVNGSGKTTTIAKLAAFLIAAGHGVLLAAADTFRPAAAEQLREWGSRLGVDVVAGAPGADPASVAHDAISAARARGAGVVLVDTAGRLHDKANLMGELGKVVRVAGASEVLLVIDGTTGQNGIAQAEAFAGAAGVTGVVVTKLDGSSKGGIAFAIESRLGIPVKMIGLGEGLADLREFEPEVFVDSLLEER